MNRKDLQKLSSINDPWDSFFTERISMLFARGFAKHGFKPNTVTLFSIISGVIGAVFLVFHNIWLTLVGILLEILSAVFDCADGQVARMTHKGSKFGRFFDGFGDTVVCIAINIAVTIRIMSEVITFTDTLWGWWIFIPAVPIAAYFHTRQTRIADYVKQLHLHFCREDHHSELETSEGLIEEFKDQKLSKANKFFVKSYISYTKSQERYFPNTKKLLTKLNGQTPENINKMYEKSIKYCKLSNCLVYNLRIYTLFVLLILSCFFNVGLTAWFFVFNVVVLEPIALIIEFKYEKVAKLALKEVE